MNTPRIEIYLTKRRKYGWRIRAANGRITAIAGEDFVNKRGAYRSFDTVKLAMSIFSSRVVLPIVDLTEKESRRG